MELVDFLLARVAEDEVWATGLSAPTARHVLAECEAKRRIVEACGPFTDRDHWTDSPPSQAVRYLAVVYVNHPDYRQEWKP